MTSYIIVYFLGVASIVAPLSYFYVKGFFKEWVKTPVITIEPKAEDNGKA